LTGTEKGSTAKCVWGGSETGKKSSGLWSGTKKRGKGLQRSHSVERVQSFKSREALQECQSGRFGGEEDYQQRPRGREKKDCLRRRLLRGKGDACRVRNATSPGARQGTTLGGGGSKAGWGGKTQGTGKGVGQLCVAGLTAGRQKRGAKQ